MIGRKKGSFMITTIQCVWEVWRKFAGSLQKAYRKSGGSRRKGSRKSLGSVQEVCRKSSESLQEVWQMYAGRLKEVCGKKPFLLRVGLQSLSYPLVVLRIMYPDSILRNTKYVPRILDQQLSSQISAVASIDFQPPLAIQFTRYR